jgi:hypothetical protein
LPKSSGLLDGDMLNTRRWMGQPDGFLGIAISITC